MKTRIAVAVAAIVVLALSTGGAMIYQDHQRELLATQQAHARALQSVEEAEADQQFYAQRVRALRQESAAAVLQARRAQTEEKVQAARAELKRSSGKVMDKETRRTLKATIESAEEDVDQASPVTLTALEEAMSKQTRAVKKSHDAWEEEQERIAAAKEAARQAEIARQEEIASQQRSSSTSGSSSQSSGSSSSSKASSSGSSSSSSSSSSGSSSKSSSSSSSSTSSGGGKTAQARSILSRYGCGSAGIKWDDPRMGAGANGTADWYNNTVLLNSSMPSYRFTYVVAHECVHLIQYRVYGGDINALQRDMNAIYGGSGFSGLEQNADCVTQRWGISTSNYTSSCGGARGSAAAAIASGHKP